MFNRREQEALIGLATALLVGFVVALSDWFRPEAMEEFRVIPRAVNPPPPVEMVIEEETPVLLNSATAAELVALPAIGPKTAERIVGFRREHGPFERLEQLLEIKGIGLRTLEKLRPLLEVE